MYLREDIKIYLLSRSSSLSVFDQLMTLQGECFRKQKGRITQRINLNNQNYFIKQHNGVGWKEILKNLLQLRLPVLGAKPEWLAIAKLQRLGISVPQVVAYGHRGYNPANLKSFILMEELVNTLSLEELCQLWMRSPPAISLKRRFIEEVAKIARNLHQHGINHRDFYLCHFLVDKKSLDVARPKLYLIDLHRAQIRKKTPKRWIIKDLAGLYFSSKEFGLTQRELFRFMKYYGGQSLREILQDKDFWEKVKHRGEKLYRDQQSSSGE